MSWLLALSYWLHLLATVIWLGGIALITLFAWPALRSGSLAANQWLAMQHRFLLAANASWVLLLVTGFFQMTNDVNYNGFLAIDSTWAIAMLLKHIGFFAMVVVTVYMQAVLHPAMQRAAFLGEQRPQQAAREQERIREREIRLLRLNLLAAVAVLFFTAVATAI
ncbi:MAG: CopD family protein [Candidatus Promineifilaceae bacterium]